MEWHASPADEPEDHDEEDEEAEEAEEEDAEDQQHDEDPPEMEEREEEEEGPHSRAPPPPPLPPPRYHATGAMGDILRRLAPPVRLPDEEVEKVMVLDVVVRRCPTRGGQTEALLLGRANDGSSVCLCVHGWHPYLIVRMPGGGWEEASERNASLLKVLFEEKLATYFERRAQGQAPRQGQAPAPMQAERPAPWQAQKSQAKGGRGEPRQHVHRISTVRGRSIYGFSGLSGDEPFLKIEMNAPHLVSSLRDVLTGYAWSGGEAAGTQLVLHPFGLTPMLVDGKTETFQSNVDGVQQFMVDTGLVGCQWIRVPSIEDAIPRTSQDIRRSTCTHEWHVSELTLLDVEIEMSIAPLRLLSFDIEAAGRRGVFPQASEDPVIQIALQFEVWPRGPLRPVLLSLRDCDPIEGVDVVCFEDEGLLLRAFRDLAVAFDVDVFMGYNILNFDFPYLHDRAAALCNEEPRPDPWPAPTPFGLARDEASDDVVVEAGMMAGLGLLEHFDGMSRVRGASLRLRETEYVSAQTGKRKRTRVMIPGRGFLDMFTAIQNSQHRLESYKLEDVAQHFLKDSKVDVPFTKITPMWLAGPAQRMELGVYCLKDAQLPLDLNAKTDILTQTIEMARCTGIPFDDVLQRGVMVRNSSLLLRRALVRKLFFPNLSPTYQPQRAAPPTRSNVKRYVGATVLEPICGIHRFVSVLDFSAMYPSIIRAHNLCYSTIVLSRSSSFVKNPPAKNNGTPTVTEEDGRLHVGGCTFVSEAEFKGLIPEVVEHLINCRAKAKRAAAEATDSLTKLVCLARELSFKICANGVYGGIGSSHSKLPLKDLAAAVTGMGRFDIECVVQTAREMYTEGEVVYGDTDSIFMRMPLKGTPEEFDGVAQAEELAHALAARVNAYLKAPKRIEVEKTLSTLVLATKKRYFGLMYKAGFKFGIDQPKIDVKGLQSVRRDGCPLVRDLVRDVIQSVLSTGAETEAAALVRRRLLDIIEDRLPIEAYTIKKTLRKTMQDCCQPMTPEELRAIREQLRSSASGPLSYAEQDSAIYAKIPLPWRMRVRLPHSMLAWRLRLRDPGSAPVPGEVIRFVMTNNGGAKCFEKVETVDAVLAQRLPIDRDYYLKSLRTPVNNIFLPIIAQRLTLCQKKTEEEEKEEKEEEERDARQLRKRAHAAKKRHLQTKRDLDDRVTWELNGMLWNIVARKRMQEAPEKKRACIEASPIARAFARQGPSSSSSSTHKKKTD